MQRERERAAVKDACLELDKNQETWIERTLHVYNNMCEQQGKEVKSRIELNVHPASS